MILIFWGALAVFLFVLCFIAMRRHIREANESMFWVALFFSCMIGISVGQFIKELIG